MGSLRPKYTFQMREYTKRTAQKTKFSQFPADLVTFTEEILNGKLHFLCSKVGEKTYYIEWIIAQSELFVRVLLKRFYYREKGELTDVQV